MRVECRIKRSGGTVVELDGTEYHFCAQSDDADEPHVCEVTDTDHIERFLSISEGYNEAGVAPRSMTPPVVTAEQEAVVEMVDEESEPDVEMELVETLQRLSVRQIRVELPNLNEKQLLRLIDIEQVTDARKALLDRVAARLEELEAEKLTVSVSESDAVMG